MCQSFLLYYPRLPSLNQCGSYVNHESLISFMGINEKLNMSLAGADPIVTSDGRTYSSVVESLQWTPERRSGFQHMLGGDYPQEVSCLPESVGNLRVKSAFPAMKGTAYRPFEACFLEVYNGNGTLIWIGITILLSLSLATMFYILRKKKF
jgi:hypothetical protein